jgi:signal transduction histidine kinase
MLLPVGAGPLFAQGSFTDLLREMQSERWSGSARQAQLAVELEARQAEAVRPREKVLVALALTPAAQRQSGYAVARARLIDLLGVAADGAPNDELVPRLRLGIAELALLEGKWGYAFRQLLEARRGLIGRGDSKVLPSVVLTAAELSLAVGMPEVGDLILRHEALALGALSMEDRYRLHLLEAKLLFLSGDFVAMSTELERLLAAIGTQMSAHSHIEYLIQRAWGSMAVGSHSAARQFLEAASGRLGAMDAPVLAAELDFTEAVLWVVTGEPTERVEDSLRRSAQLFAAEGQSGRLLGLYQRLFRYPGLEQLSKAEHPFMSVLAEVPDRGLEPASQAMRLQALAELWGAGEGTPDGTNAVTVYREAMWMRNEFHQGFLSLARDWLMLSGRTGPGVGGVSHDGPFYIWVLFLSLTIAILILLLRFRAQRHLNEELEKLVEKAFEAEQAAELANRLKSQFLANVSHEIRAPLSGLVGMASILDEVIKDPSARQYVETIRACSENLSVLMNDLIDLGRIDAGRVEIEVKPFSLKPLLEHNIGLVQEAANEKGLALGLHYRREEIPSRLLGDRVRIGQILSNLLQNAIKFTPKGSVVLEVDYEPVGEADGQLILTVSDTGIGISPERQRTVFEPFSKGPGNEEAGTSGSGLGLAICQRLTGLMGGDISLESDPGRGSTFRVRLPLKETDFSA